MKKFILSLAIALSSYCSYAQTWSGSTPGNIYYNSGNVGIGTTTPDTKLVIQATNSDNLISFWNSLGVKKAYIGTAVASGQMIPGSTISDLVIRAENQKIMFSADAGATTHMTVGANGNVGIGTIIPSVKLDVVGQANFVQTIAIKSNLVNSTELLMYKPSGSYYDLASNDSGFALYNSSTAGYIFNIDNDGNMGINTTDTHGYKLAVNGSAIATSMTVKLNANWPDYVFKPSYQLPSLTAVKAYVDKNQHLPDMPSEQEVKDNGINLGEIVKVQTKKIEELTLYLIEKDKQDKEKDVKLAEQQTQIDDLKAQLRTIAKYLRKN